MEGAWIVWSVATLLATRKDGADPNCAIVTWPVRRPATMDDSSGIAWNTTRSSAGFVRPQ